jgi:hypothetical protein
VSELARGLPAETVEVPDDLDEFNEFAVEHRWSDGLPLVPATRERVERLLERYDRPRNEVIAQIPPRWADATIERLAVNAVMAGCLPDYLPFVVTAIQAAAHPAVNLFGAQGTTHPSAMLVMLNGPLAVEAGANGGSGAFGPGTRANATIGRAVRLALQNIGGAYHGDTDLSTLGSPAKYTYCFAENEAESPWPPFHVDRGFSPEASTVTVCVAEPPHNVSEHVATDPRKLLGTVAYTMSVPGANNAYGNDMESFVGFCPDHARILGRHGFTRRDIQEYFFSAARIPWHVWVDRGAYGAATNAKFVDALDEGMPVPIADRPEDFNVFCIGGPGLHSCWIPTFGMGRSNTCAVALADGTPAERLGDFSR